MSDECTTTETITKIEPIPGKDRIELATIQGYQSIVARGRYQVGDRVCYIPEQSLVPFTLQQELGLEGRLTGANKDRVKAIKMGGVLSQGIVCQPEAWVMWDTWAQNGQNTGTLDDMLGVSKWTPKMPISFGGNISRPKGNAPIVPMYDIENIKKQRHWSLPIDPVASEREKRAVYVDGQDGQWYDPFIIDGQPIQVVVTEKIHGTNVTFHMDKHGNVFVYSKGIGQRLFVLDESDTNTYWHAWKSTPNVKLWMESQLGRGFDAVTVHGEVYGRGIQDLTYSTDPKLAIFEARCWMGYGETPLSASDLGAWPNLPLVPVLHVGYYDHDMVVALSEAPCSAVDGVTMREGVVVVPLKTEHKFALGTRRIAKFINPKYLLRGGDTTEFQ